MVAPLLAAPRDPRLIVGFENADDAGVIAVDPQRALVQTVDFFMPVVDDPREYGAIAAANALSDVYAMGGKPFCAMNLLGVPDGVLPNDVIQQILVGAAEVVAYAGAVLVGGHSVKSPEPFFGLSVSGWVHPEKVWRNAGARPGDALVLTKPLGTGILTTARKRDAVDDAALREAIRHMRTLNDVAADVARPFEVHACTDITGNGLAGHAWEMARGSGVEITFFAASLPVLDGARELAAHHSPGGARANARYVGGGLDLGDLDEADRAIALDPQTSGGLLIAVPEAQAADLVAALRAAGVPGVRVGRVADGAPMVRFRAA